MKTNQLECKREYKNIGWPGASLLFIEKEGKKFFFEQNGKRIGMTEKEVKYLIERV